MAAQVIDFASGCTFYQRMAMNIRNTDDLEELRSLQRTVARMDDRNLEEKQSLYSLIEEQKNQIFRRMYDSQEEITVPGIYRYTPEMGDVTPRCKMQASIGRNHFFVDTPYELKGRGIIERPVTWHEGSEKEREGWRSYRVTERAFKKLAEKYPIRMECNLD